MAKLSLYLNTVRYMKPGQICRRICKMAGVKCTIGCRPAGYDRNARPFWYRSVEELDFDEAFLRRFPAGELLQNRVTFLHRSEVFSWKGPWEVPGQSPLWNYNLQYFEFLFPLLAAFRKTGGEAYLEKIKETVRGWIAGNPESGGGIGWDPYPIALRLCNWMAAFSCLQEELKADPPFTAELLESMHRQYRSLSEHLEKDLLGNHYFEDLKTLILCAVFFRDEGVLCRCLPVFRAECAEQILPDGMHFERSPMYHKIILEDMLRVCTVLRQAGRKDSRLEAYLQPMLDCAWSMEAGLERLPLFNDCGTNVSKSLESLCRAAKRLFGLTPVFRDAFPDAGYYIFRSGEYQLIADAGKPGPEYLPGHAHCDAMSFELFQNGRPVLVNCGTFAYQCAERLWFKSTQAHNTVMADGVEQSRCWGAFRMAARSHTVVTEKSGNQITMRMTDQKGTEIQRILTLTPETLTIRDSSPGHGLTAWLHLREPLEVQVRNGCLSEENMPYSEEFGEKKTVRTIVCRGESDITLTVMLP